MTKEEAERLALAAIKKRNIRIHNGPISCYRKESDDRNKGGPMWIVWVPLDIPDGFEDDHIRVYVFEPNGKTEIPLAL